MKKVISVFFVFLSISKLIYSQDSEEPSVPIHFVRLDIIKGIVSQLQMNYERFNGKKGALQIGAGVYFPYFYTASIPGGYSVYKGYSCDIQRKFYIHFKYTSIYLAPKFIYTHKECFNKEIYEGGGGSIGPSSSYAMWDWITAKINSYSALASVGFLPIVRKGFNIDISLGLGGTLNDINRTVTPQRYTTSLKSGHFIEYSPKVQIGAAIGFGIKEKSK